MAQARQHRKHQRYGNIGDTGSSGGTTACGEYGLSLIHIAMLADPANPVFTLRVRDAFAGLIGFKSADSRTRTIEIGYWLRSEYQGRGLMTAAAEALCRMAFGQMGMENVEIKCAAGNLRSNRIPLRLGFRLDRIEVRGEQLADGEFTDLNVYRLPRP